MDPIENYFLTTYHLSFTLHWWVLAVLPITMLEWEFWIILKVNFTKLGFKFCNSIIGLYIVPNYREKKIMANEIVKISALNNLWGVAFVT